MFNNATKSVILTVFSVTALLFIATLSAADQSSSEKKVNSVQQKTVAEIGADAKILAKLLKNTLTYQADFEQSVYRENSDKPEITIGHFLIQRPNHFKWQTTTPYEQIIVADGDNLWTYDPELEQATLQSQDTVLADSPLLLLTSSVDSLVKAFDIEQIKSTEKEEQMLFGLKPKKNSLFESVHILLENKKIKEFFLVDTLGGRTSVKFSKVQVNKKIQVKEFIFVPPEGIDVIDSRDIPTD